MKQNREIGSDVVSNPPNCICILKRQNPVLSTFDLVVCIQQSAGIRLWEFLVMLRASANETDVMGISLSHRKNSAMVVFQLENDVDTTDNILKRGWC